MGNKTFLDFLPTNFRHEKSYFIQNNLKKIRAIAIFKKQIGISPPEAYLLLHCGIGSIKSLSLSTPYELERKVGRLERTLKVKTQTVITLALLNKWIKRAKKAYKSI